MQSDIGDQLRAVPGLTVVSEEPSPVSGYRLFALDYLQPVDHHDPAGGFFKQRVQLLHRSENRPTVLYTNGYEVPAQVSLSEPAQMLDANQLVVGQRFFTGSRPEPADWSKLTIWQAASDHHRLISALRRVYSGRWIGSGIAKGGAAAVYYRRFYPDDVAGVVSYGAPDNVDDDEDSRYNAFLENVGTPKCRQGLKDIQRAALRKRDEIVPRYEAWAAANGFTFDQVIGSADRAFELIVMHLRYAFWQFYLTEDCVRIPPATASADQIWDFLDEIVSWQTPVDQTLLARSAWFYQAVNQMGFPSVRAPYLAGLLHYPDIHEAVNLLPPSLRPTHDPYAMEDIDQWVRTRSSRMLFVNGGNDPSPAEHFVPGQRDSYAFTAPGASYRTGRIATLPDHDKEIATAAVRRWAGVGR
ncbi:S28 family serine protease [Amycolatopsis vastitatis]|uniref:S28 family serine protease n=1 Tax=Amycolatopsis vastitatis TaxID=1905142 RepID=UPI00130423AA|nr:S28 family serine protease [Amycolatopsis vastitatis]